MDNSFMLPLMKPAVRAKLVRQTETQEYRKDHVTQLLQHDYCITKEFTKTKKTDHPLPPLTASNFRISGKQVKELMKSPTICTNTIQECLAHTYGKTIYTTLPINIDPDDTVFGIKTDQSITAGSLLNPFQAPCNMMKESHIGHYLYVLTHQDYDSGEQVNRKYNNPPLNKHTIWGMKTPHDPSGRLVRRLFMADTSNFIANKIVCDLKALQPQIGTSLELNYNIHNVTEGEMFGMRDTNEEGAKDTIQEIEQNKEKTSLYAELKNINSLRNAIKNKHNFIYKDFVQHLRSLDTGQTGYLSSDLVYKVFSTLRIATDRNNLEKLLKRMNILTIDNRICYLKFADVINIHSPLSDLGMVNDDSCRQYYETTYQAACRDLSRPVTVEIRIERAKKQNKSLSQDQNLQKLIEYSDNFMNKSNIFYSVNSIRMSKHYR